MKNHAFKLKLGERELTAEIKGLAERANGEVLLSYGQTVVLATAVMSSYDKEGLGFFPLTVDYEEKYYAAGKIFGSRYIKREGRPSEEAILTARLIDRAIRPRFPENLKREVQVIATCLSWDSENDPDILGLLGASIALSVSDIPWSGPIAVVRVCRIDGEFVLNPVYEQRGKTDLDLVVAVMGKDGQVLINMLEARAEEIDEDVIAAAEQWAQPFLRKLIDFQNQIISEAGIEKLSLEKEKPDRDLEKEMKDFLADKLERVLFSKKQNSEELNALRDESVDFIEKQHPSAGKAGYAKDFFEQEVNRLLHQNILNKEKRPDGRKLDELRSITCQAGVLPRTHGSGLFCRGQTKALSILTLGAPGDQQLVEGMEIIGKKRFMHHYNFPPYSVGEVKPLRGPARRDIGHGMLAEKALLPLIPDSETFPYTIRVVSEILSSNGSSSMASVSSSSLALMDAGVPLKRPAAGIALGLIQDEKGGYKILTDIQGPEDHHGDMDFKAAGTKEGITALQMDVKIAGINSQILKEVLRRAKKARHQILEEMEKVLPQARPELSPFAPRILTLRINPEKIRDVVGPGGRIIKEIIEKCGVEIDIQQDGSVFVTSETEEAAKEAMAWIKNITREIKIGDAFQGKVKRLLRFGAMVEIIPGQDGLVHISEFGRAVKNIESAVKIGQNLSVRVSSIDEQGRINLSLNRTNQ